MFFVQYELIAFMAIVVYFSLLLVFHYKCRILKKPNKQTKTKNQNIINNCNLK